MLRECLKYITTNYLRDTNQISARATNYCIRKGLDTFYKILSCFEDNGSYLKAHTRSADLVNAGMNNIGRKTLEELDRLCINIISKIEVENQNDKFDETFKVLNKLTKQKRERLVFFVYSIIETEGPIIEKVRFFSNCITNIFRFAVDFYEDNNHFPMFWILEQYLKYDSTREVKILIDTLAVFQDKQPQKLLKVANKYNLTSERIRQIRNEIFYKTFKITNEVIEYKKNDRLIKYSQLLQNKDDWSYTLELLQGTNYINQESFEIQEYLKKEQCNLSIVLVLQIIAYIFRDKYTLFGGYIMSSKSMDKAFIIKKEFTEIFNFEKFIEEFTNHIADNVTEYDLNIDEFLYNSIFWTSKVDLNKFDSIVNIVKDILQSEFHLYPNIDGLITIPIIKKRSPLNVVYEILKTKGEPMHIDDIFVKFKKILPKHRFNEAARLRPYLSKHEAISCIRRKSIYMLKE